MMSLTCRLIVFSGVPHYRRQNKVMAHGGFAREIEVWAELFGQVLVVSPFSIDTPVADAIPYEHVNIQFFSLGTPFISDGIFGKIKLLIVMIGWVLKILKQIKTNDVLMARGPDGIGFLGWVLSRLKPNAHFAKYADQWLNYEEEPLGYQLQKRFYYSKAFGGPVMIYGKPEESRPHLIPMITSSVSKKEWVSAGEKILARQVFPPYKLLFVGRFVFDKGVDVLLKAYKLLLDEDIPVELTIVGDGPEQINIQKMLIELGLQNKIDFEGWVAWDRLSFLYSRSHLFVHASRKEGFGKVLLEAMTYGLPVIATDVGMSKSLIEKTGSGLLIFPDDPRNMANTIRMLVAEPSRLRSLGEKGREASSIMLLENLAGQYKDFLKETLHLVA